MDSINTVSEMQSLSSVILDLAYERRSGLVASPGPALNDCALNEHDVAQITGLSVSIIQELRSTSMDRLLTCRREDVLLWLADRRVTSTADALSGGLTYRPHF